MVKIFVCLAIVALCNTAIAEEANRKKKWERKHPRQAEVINRANNEEKKNDAASAQGKITADQANRLDREDEAIKREERNMARKNGGKITPEEQRKLNRQENRVNRQRANMERRDAQKAAPTATNSTTSPTN